MSKVLQIFLIACYGLAWMWSSSRPFLGFAFLALIGTLISIPTIFKNVLVGMLISAVIGALVAAFPCLAPLVVIWIFIRIAARIGEIVENFMPLILSSVLYLGLLFVPVYMRESLVSAFDITSTTVAAATMFLMGAALMHATCYVFEKCGRNSSKTAAFIVGLPGFIILLVIFLFTIHSGDAGDGDGQF